MAGGRGNAIKHRHVQRLLDLLQDGMLGTGLLIVVVHHQLDLILIHADAATARSRSAAHCGWREIPD